MARVCSSYLLSFRKAKTTIKYYLKGLKYEEKFIISVGYDFDAIF